MYNLQLKGNQIFNLSFSYNWHKFSHPTQHCCCGSAFHLQDNSVLAALILETFEKRFQSKIFWQRNLFFSVVILVCWKIVPALSEYCSSQTGQASLGRTAFLSRCRIWQKFSISLWRLPHSLVSCLDGRPAPNWWRRSLRKPCSQHEFDHHSPPSAQTPPTDAHKCVKNVLFFYSKPRQTYSHLYIIISHIFINLRLFLLNELENFMGQLVIFGTGVCEDVNKGPWQGDLQGDLNGADAHLWTVAAALWNEKGVISKW